MPLHKMDTRLDYKLIALSIAAAMTILSGCDRQHWPPPDELDLNGDGKPDVLYEPHENGYYELSDRNFDGKIDESVHFNREHRPVYSRADDDFDGNLDTLVEYQHSQVTRVLVDSNRNFLFDAVTDYVGGVPQRTASLISRNGRTSLQRWSYRRTIPLYESESPTDTSEVEFHQTLKPMAELN